MSTAPSVLKVLVTGGSGFIGSHVCDALIAAGHEVVCLDSFITGKRTNVAHLEQHPRFTLREGDVRALATCIEASKGMDVILHLAALGSVPRSIDDPLPTEAANLGAFLNVLEACRANTIRRMVYASSSSVYGDARVSPKREGQEGRALSPYAVTKLMDEAYAHLYFELHGVNTIGLRFFNVFGERQDPQGPYAAAIPKFIHALLQHHAPVVNGDGSQTRDFTYVGNAVHAMLKAMHCKDERALGRVFNIAYGASTDLLTLIDRLRAHLATGDPAIAAIGVSHAAERPGDVHDSLANIDAAHQILGYEPPFDLEQGLGRAVPWYATHWA